VGGSTLIWKSGSRLSKKIVAHQKVKSANRLNLKRSAL
jgi:hypothetical protein